MVERKRRRGAFRPEGLVVFCDAKRRGEICGAFARVMRAQFEYVNSASSTDIPELSLTAASYEIVCPNCGARRQISRYPT